MVRLFVFLALVVIWWRLLNHKFVFGHYHVEALFAWYDIWIGAYYDRTSQKLYLFPIPFFGISIWRKRLTLTERNAKLKRARKQTHAIVKAKAL